MYEDRFSGLDARISHNLSFPPHSHYSIEIAICLNGKTGVICNGKEAILCRGDIMVAFPNDIHGYFSAGEGEFLMLFASPLLLPPSFKELLSCRYDNFCIGLGGKATSLACEFYSAFRSECSEFEKTGYFCLILANAMKGLQKLSDGKGLDEDGFTKILKYISEHYTEPLSLRAVASYFGTDYFNLSKTFSQRLSVTFTHYIHILRTEQAKLLLRSTKKSVAEICYDCGFSDIRTFNRVFKNLEGMSPKAFRLKS